MFSVIYDNSAFSGALAMVGKSDMDLKFVPMLWPCLVLKWKWSGTFVKM